MNRFTRNLSELLLISRPVVENVRRYASSLQEASKRLDTQAVWRLDSSNPFVEVPQAWFTTLSTKKEVRAGITQLHPEIFRVAPRLDILHRNICWQENYRNLQITKQLSKAEMPGGGHKPWPQKRMGRHHAGSIRSPHFRCGGFANGVRGPKTWFYMLPDAIRLEGLCVALTIKHVQNDLVLVDNYEGLPTDDAQFMHDLADARNWGYSALFVHVSSDVPLNLANVCETIPSFNVMPVHGLNCLSIVKHQTLIISMEALRLLQYRILYHKNRAETLQKKYCYTDYKQLILAEGEHETDPTHIPFI